MQTQEEYYNNERIISPEYSSKDIPKIRVVVRKRPMNKKEITKSDMDIIETKGSQTIIVKELKNKVDLTKYIEEHHFQFDNVFDENANNETIYVSTVRPMVDAAFKKAKITCFAYGQTGSGKTYTMMGDSKDIPGLYLLCAYDIFNNLEKESYNHLEIWVSFYEIYCGKLFDLLNERNTLQAREDGKQNICIVGLVEKQVDNLKSLMGVIDLGLRSRTTGVTGANTDSSRSHAVLQIVIKEQNGNQHGKISFIDLAGSERAVDTIDTNRQTKLDGAEINKSLLALKECIRALDQEKKHTPFRGSKLTMVLRDSFTGNCKTMMIANISPCLSCSEHTLNTLRYADRVKELRKERNDKEFLAKEDKDPSEVLAQMLMMPRQHTKTVKYNLEVKKNLGIQIDKDNKIVSGNMQNANNQGAKGPLHINQLINSKNFVIPNNKNNNMGENINKNYNDNNYNQKNNNNNYGSQKSYDDNILPNNNNYMNLNNNIKENQKGLRHNSAKTPNPNNFNVPEMMRQENNNGVYNNNYTKNQGKNNLATNSQGTRSNNNLILPNMNNQMNNLNLNQNNFEGEIDFENYVSKYSYSAIRSEDEFQKLSNEHEKLINNILQEEEEFIQLHKNHIDDVVDLVKQEMNLINEVDKPGSDIENYVVNLDKVLLEKMKNIDQIRQRLKRFRIMLKDEEAISANFMNSNDFIDSYEKNEKKHSYDLLKDEIEKDNFLRK